MKGEEKWDFAEALSTVFFWDFLFFAVYIYRTIYRANYFSGTADFVHFQLTFGALAALCAYLFLYKSINEQIPKGNQKDRDISSLWW